MKSTIFFTLILLPWLLFANGKVPLWEYPILGSEYIGDNCSEETNRILMQISFSSEGEVKSISFLKKSSIPNVNEEAKRYILEESPFMEFEDMTQDEKQKYRVVNMSYLIPCTNS